MQSSVTCLGVSGGHCLLPVWPFVCLPVPCCPLWFLAVSAPFPSCLSTPSPPMCPLSLDTSIPSPIPSCHLIPPPSPLPLPPPLLLFVYPLNRSLRPLPFHPLNPLYSIPSTSSSIPSTSPSAPSPSSTILSTPSTPSPLSPP